MITFSGPYLSAWQFSSQWKAWWCPTCATEKVRVWNIHENGKDLFNFHFQGLIFSSAILNFLFENQTNCYWWFEFYHMLIIMTMIMSNILSSCLDLRYPKPNPNPTRTWMYIGRIAEKFGKLGFYVCNSPWWTLELLTELTNTGHLPKVMTWSKSEIVITIFLLFWKMGWPVATPTQYPSFEHLSLSQRRPHSLIGKLKTSHFKGIKNYNDPWVRSYIENVWHTHITEDSK